MINRLRLGCFKCKGRSMLFVLIAFVLMIICPELLGRQKAHPLDWAMIVARYVLAAHEAYVEEKKDDPESFDELVPFLPHLPAGINYDTYPIVFFEPTESSDLLFAIPMDIGLVIGRRFGTVEFMPSTHHGRIFPTKELRNDKLLLALIVSLFLNALLVFRLADSKRRVFFRRG